MYSLGFDRDWMGYYQGLPENMKKRFMKRMKKYREFPTHSFRHAKLGVQYFIDEIGQYRVCFVSDEEKKARTFYFIGNHKEYEKFMGIRK